VLRRVHTDGNTAPVVFDAYDIVFFEGNDDPVAKTRHRFVDTVVYDFIYEMMKSLRPGRTDIHTRPLAHRFETF